MDAKDISDLALRVAAMSDHERDEFDNEVSDLRAKLRLREENRIAELRAMPDLEVINRIISVACSEAEATLQELRDAGFVRNPPTYPKQSFIIGEAKAFEGWARARTSLRCANTSSTPTPTCAGPRGPDMPCIRAKTSYYPADRDPLTGELRPGAIPPGIYCETEGGMRMLRTGLERKGVLASILPAPSLMGLRIQLATPEQVEAFKALDAREQGR
ncbi:hypothetical protein [Methylobacterium sp. 37f]|uniref:hypothetical protein n=1 Tax=Methylobacterium sp. 37f TaxID=2817058 RepID=UPI001FFD9069|nr:hypothetical protein [Methylobacterium sp. 37f]MCK2055280.1 hypothetical protein [Methylobacterium sp. 37f]